MGIPLMFVAFASFVCFVLVLVKQFQNAGAVHGIIGIVTCGIWTFIWGWINAKEQNIVSLMLLWTLFVVIRLFVILVG